MNDHVLSGLKHIVKPPENYTLIYEANIVIRTKDNAITIPKPIW
jgi:hypothetical protein